MGRVTARPVGGSPLDEVEEMDDGDLDLPSFNEAKLQSTTRRNKMAKKEEAKKGSEATESKKKDKAAEEEEEDDLVTVADLAKEYKMDPRAIRIKLRKSDLEKPEGGQWAWPEDSKALKAVRALLEEEDEAEEEEAPKKKGKKEEAKAPAKAAPKKKGKKEEDEDEDEDEGEDD